MGCGCNKQNMCDSLKSLPAEIVYDKAYTPLTGGTEKFRKYQNYINQDLQDGIKDNTKSIEDLNRQTELLRKEDELIHSEINALKEDLEDEIEDRMRADDKIQQALDAFKEETSTNITALRQEDEKLQAEIDAVTERVVVLENSHEEITETEIETMF